MSQINEACRMTASRGVSRQQANQHHRRADKGVERQLHRRVLPPRGTPDGDNEVLRHNGDFVKDKEQKEIEAEKNPVDSADQRQKKGEKLIGAQLDIPTEQDASHGSQAGQQHQHAADAVGGQQKVNT